MFLVARFVVAILILLPSSALSQKNKKINYTVRDTSKFGNDGPYIFHQGELIISKAIVKINDKYEIVTDTLPYASSNIWINRDHPTKKGFAVKTSAIHRKSKTEYKTADSIFVVSDIEGNFDAFEQLLISAGVVDKNYKWTFGKGHLVILGDVFDRGLEVTQCLWLIYKLEKESPKGHVHFVIGNHESMNFLGYIDYVRNKYRLVSYALAMNIPDMFSQYTILGEWMRNKNMTLKIGDHLFVHGGISPYLVREELSLKKINKYGRQNYDTEELEGQKKLVFSQKGPMWYRGYFYGKKGKYDQITEQQLDSVLSFYQVKQIMVGHTVMDSISPRFNYKLYPVDVSHRKNLTQGKPTEGLLIKNNVFYRHYTNGKRVKISK